MRIYGITEQLPRKVTNTTDKGKKQILNKMINHLSPNCKDMDGYSLYGDKYCFLDGRRVFISNTDLGFKASDKQFQLDKMFEEKTETTITIPREYVEYLKKELSKEYKKPMIVEDDGFFIAFNPEFLLDAIKFSNSETFYYSKEFGVSKELKEYPTLHRPLFQKDENGNVLTVTLPVIIDPMIDDLERSLLYVEI